MASAAIGSCSRKRRGPGLLAQRLLFSLAAFVWLEDGEAAAAIGAAKMVVNRVDAQLDEQERVLAPRDEVFSNEVIRTATASASQLRFRDDTELKIGPDSEVVLDRFVYLEGNAQEVAMSMAVGLLRFTSGKLPKSAYTIRAPAATIGVRGTVFDLLADDDGLTTILVYVGEALFRTNDGEVFAVGPCQMMSAGRAGEPVSLEPEAAVRLSSDNAARIFEMQRLLERGAAPDEPSLQDCIDPAGGGGAGEGPMAPFPREPSPEQFQNLPERRRPAPGGAFGFGGSFGGSALFSPPLPSPFAEPNGRLPLPRDRPPERFLEPPRAEVPEPGSLSFVVLLTALVVMRLTRRR